MYEVDIEKKEEAAEGSKQLDLSIEISDDD